MCLLKYFLHANIIFILIPSSICFYTFDLLTHVITELMARVVANLYTQTLLPFTQGNFTRIFLCCIVIPCKISNAIEYPWCLEMYHLASDLAMQKTYIDVTPTLSMKFGLFFNFPVPGLNSVIFNYLQGSAKCSTIPYRTPR